MTIVKDITFHYSQSMEGKTPQPWHNGILPSYFSSEVRADVAYGVLLYHSLILFRPV